MYVLLWVVVVCMGLDTKEHSTEDSQQEKKQDPRSNETDLSFQVNKIIEEGIYFVETRKFVPVANQLVAR